jgi:hypothetical protein
MTQIQFLSIVDVYDGLHDLKHSFDERIAFYTMETSLLIASHSHNFINESVYLRRLCLLNIEKSKINKEYVELYSEFVKGIPEKYYYSDIILPFEGNLI